MKTKEGEEAAVVCGGEGHEEAELIHSCPCDGGSTLAVGNTGLWGCSKQSSAVDACLMCAARGSQAGRGKSATKLGTKKCTEDVQGRNSSTRRHVKSDQSCKGVKRLRSALTNGGPASKGEGQQATVEKQDCDVSMDDKGNLRPVTSSVAADLSKADAPLLGRRFSDVAATVPIKKRRLQLMEVARSPSPPPPPPSPRPVLQVEGAVDPVPDVKPQVAQDLVDSEMAEEDGRHQVLLVESDERDSGDRASGLESSRGVDAVEDVVQGTEDSVSSLPIIEEADSEKEGLKQTAGVDATPVGAVEVETGGHAISPSESDVVDGERHEPAVEEVLPHGQPHEDSSVVASSVGQSEVEGVPEPELASSTELHSDPAVKNEGAAEVGEPDVAAEFLKRDEEAPPLLQARSPHGNEPLAVMAAAVEEDHGRQELGHQSSALPTAVLAVQEGSKSDTGMSKDGSGAGRENRHVDPGRPHVGDKNFATAALQGMSSKDVRLHWDLNMDMEEWERPTEDGGIEGVGGPSRLAEMESRLKHLRALEQNSTRVESSNGAGLDKKTDTEVNVQGERDLEGEAQCVDVGEFMEYDEPEFDEEDEPAAEGNKLAPGKVSEKVSLNPQTEVDIPAAKTVENWDVASGEEFEAEHVDYDDSDNNDIGPDPEERVPIVQRSESPLEAEKQVNTTTVDGAELKGNRKWKSATGGYSSRTKDYASWDSASKDVVKASQGKFTAAAEVVAGDRTALPDFTKSSFQEAANTSSVVGRISDERLVVKHAETYGADSVDRKAKELGNRRDDKWSQASRDVPAAAGVAGYVKRMDGPSSRMKSTGWDQLPEGFENPADALRAVKEPVRPSRTSLWAGPAGRGSSPGGAAVSARFGHGRAAAAGSTLGERVRQDDGPWARDDISRGRRVDEPLDMSPRISSPRDGNIGRGRSRGRGVSPATGRGRGGRSDIWMDGANGPNPPPWVPPNRHSSPPARFDMGFGAGPRGPANAAAVAAAKVESSGFVVAPDGTITKAESPGGRGGGPRSGRGVGPGMFNMPRGMGVGPGMGLGRGMGMGLGRGMGMGPGMGMGMGPGMGMGMGPGVGMGMPGPAGRGGGRGGGRGMMDNFSGPPYGRGMAHFSGRDEYLENNWMRRERSLSPPRGSRRRSPVVSSRSRSKSPRLRSPGGAGTPVVGMKRSRSPGLGLPMPLSPARRAVPAPPKLPLPPPPPRNQRSPPAGLKRLTDKREGDRSRERDRERSLGRARSPVRRTSPHVVHGSSLMDERDRALLAGIRHVSPPTSGRHRQDGGVGPSGGAVGPETVGVEGSSSIEARRPCAAAAAGEEGLKKEEVMLLGLRTESRSREGSRVNHDRDRERRVDNSSSLRPEGKDEDSSSRVKVSSSRLGGNSFKSYASSNSNSREGDDDVAPRRRRPSP